MNSAQRRQARRKFPHVVAVKGQDGHAWFDLRDDRIEGGLAWCRRHLRKGQWKYEDYWRYAEFQFARERDATYFALKWT